MFGWSTKATCLLRGRATVHRCMTKAAIAIRALLILFAVSIATSVTPAHAQDNLGQSWKDLSPEQRKQKGEQFYSNLPESQKRNLKQNQQRFQALPGNQKLKLCRRFYNQNGYYPPACQSLLSP